MGMSYFTLSNEQVFINENNEMCVMLCFHHELLMSLRNRVNFWKN